MLRACLDWILKNKEWLFSGVGITVATFLFALAKRSRESRNSQHGTPIWKVTRVLRGHWEGSATEHPLYASEQRIFSVTWDFEVHEASVKATSTARSSIDGVLYTDTYRLVGDFVQDRFFRLHYQNENEQELSFGAEVIEVSLDGKSFAGVYVGLSSTRAAIVSGVLQARKTRAS
jgi:hypothetical protein